MAVQTREIERDDNPTSLDVIRREADMLVAVNSGYLHMVDDASLFGGPSISAISPYTLQKINESLLAYKERAEEEEQQLKLQDEKREKEQDGDEQKRENLQDALEEMSEQEWLQTESEYAGMKKTGRQWREFGTFAQKHRTHLEEELRSRGYSEEAIKKGLDSAEIQKIAPRDRTPEQKEIMREAAKDPNTPGIYGIIEERKREFEIHGIDSSASIDTRDVSAHIENSARSEMLDTPNQRVNSNTEIMIDTKGVSAKAEFDRVADKDVDLSPASEKASPASAKKIELASTANAYVF